MKLRTRRCRTAACRVADLARVSRWMGPLTVATIWMLILFLSPAASAVEVGWIEIAGEPMASGGSPRAVRGGETVFELAPNDRMIVDLADHDQLAWVPWKKSRDEGLEAWSSLDGAAWVEAHAALDGEARVLPISPLGGRFVELRNRSSSGEAMEFRLFASSITPQSPTWKTLPMTGAPATAASRWGFEDAEPERHWSLPTVEGATVDVRGERWVEIETRYHFSAADVAGPATYRIVAEAGEARWFLEHQTSVATQTGVRSTDGITPMALGGVRSDRIELPKGAETLRLRATGPVLARVRAADEERLLLPARNGGAAVALEATRRPERSLIDHEAGDLGGIDRGAQSGLDADLRPFVAWLARDNRYRGSAEQLVAAETVLADRIDRATRRELRRLRESAAKWEDLLPHENRGSSELRYRRVLAPRSVPTPNDDEIERGGEGRVDDPPLVLFREAIEEKAFAMGGGYFTTAPVDRSIAPRYAVERAEQPLRLRLLVHAEAGTRLTIGWEDEAGAERSKTVRIEPDLGVELATRPSLQESALALWLTERKRSETDATETRLAQPLTRAHRAVIELPPRTDSFSIWADRPYAEVAPQRLVDARFELGESEYLFWVEHLRDRGWTAERLFAALTASHAPTASDRVDHVALRALWNHWLPFSRSLRSQSTLFANGIEPLVASTGRCSGPEVDSEPLAVIAAWGRESRDCTPSPEAVERTISALRELDRNALADRILAQSILYGETDTSRRALRMWLDDRARLGDSWGRVEAAGAASLRRADREDLLALAEALASHGSADRAVWVTSLIPNLEGWDSIEAIVRSAMDAGWWRTFDRHVEQLGVRERTEWIDRRAAREGRAVGIRQASAGRAFSGGRPQSRFADEALWQDGSWMVREAVGAERLRLAHSTTSSVAFRASEGAPLRLRVPGAATVRLRIRALAEPGAERIDDREIVLRRAGRTVSHLVRGGSVVASPKLEVPQLLSTPGERTLGLRREIELVFDTAEEVELLAPDGDVVVEIDAHYPRGAETRGLRTIVREAHDSASQVCVAELADAGVGTTCFSEAAVVVVPDAQPTWGARRRTGARPPEEMLEIVRQAERGDAEARRAAAARGQAIWERAGRPPEARSLRERSVRATAWRQVKSVQSSAGVRRVEGVGWDPEDPSLRLEKALLAELDEADLLVVGHRVLSFEGVEPEARALRLSVELLALPPARLQPVDAVLAVEGRDDLVVRLDATARSIVRELLLPAGEARVTVRMKTPRHQHYLRVRVEERSESGDYAPRIRSWRRNYDVATPGDPLRIRVQGPAWLRVDEVVGGDTRSTHRFVETAGWQSYEIPVVAGRDESLYRVFERVAVDPAVEPQAPSRPAVTGDPVPSLGHRWSSSRAPSGPRALLERDTGRARDWTQSVTLAARSRRLVEEDVAAEGSEDFSEARWVARHGKEFVGGGNRFFEGGVLGRVRDLGEPTMGLFGHLRIDPSRTPWVISVDARVYAQRVAETEWSGLFDASVGRSFAWTSRTSSRVRLGGFARELSLDEEAFGGSAAEVDQDLFTRYKTEHRYGAHASFATTHSLYRDLQLFSEVGVRTNESPSDLERAEVQVGVRQLVGSLRFDLRYRYARFFEDEDRRSDFDRERLTLAGFWERWTPGLGRWEIGGALSYDVRDSEVSGRLELTRHFSEGRALDDFRPVAAGFRSLRERRLHSQP